MIASEDGSFADHDGVDWEAMEKAWQRNAEAEEVRRAGARPGTARAPRQPGAPGAKAAQDRRRLHHHASSWPRTCCSRASARLLRKGQELVLAIALERMLSKERILEIYLNSVEWGEGVFGAEAAAQHYYRKSAAAYRPTRRRGWP